MNRFFFIMQLAFCGGLPLFIQATPYRTISSGDWSDITIWESFNGAWGPAGQPPGINDEVTIRAGHIVEILLMDAAAGFLMVELGASLLLEGTARALEVGNSNPAADFVLEGFFQDNASSGAGNGIQFSSGGSWRMGSDATLLKSNNSSAVRYRDHYHNGMANIPATALWIIRYVGLGHPAFSTIGTYYPNLNFESTAGLWAPLTGFSQFTGSSGRAIIKGNLDIGGNGTSPVTITNENLNNDPILIQGNLIIRSGSVLTTDGDVLGTGFEVWGDVTVNGVLDTGSQGSRLVFGGNTYQVVDGIGLYTLHDVDMDNPANVGLFQPIVIGGDLQFYQGVIEINQSNLMVQGDIIDFGPGKYVRTNGLGPTAGALGRVVSGNSIFPVGNSAYNPASVADFSGEFFVRVEDQVLEEGSAGIPFTTMIVDRSWHVEPIGIGAFSLALQWNGGEELPGFDASQCYISIYDNGWHGSSPLGAQGSDPFQCNRTNLQNSGVYAIASNGALPVELSYFNGSADEKGIHLAWETAAEVNNDFFRIDRSGPLDTSVGNPVFETIAIVNGEGTTSKPTNYQFRDRDIETGNYLYRLQQVDFDGTSNYSQTIVINNSINKNKNEWAIFPNPARDQVTAIFQHGIYEEAEICLFGALGQVIRCQTIKKREKLVEFNLQEIPTGIYWLGTNYREKSDLIKVFKY